MLKRRTFAAACMAVALTGGSAWAQGVVTIYSADGLRDGSPNWFQTQFDAFTKATGIKVQYVEGGSAGVMERVAKEKSNPQADVLVTLAAVHPEGGRRRAVAAVHAGRRGPDRRRATRTRRAASSRWSTTTRTSSTTRRC